MFLHLNMFFVNNHLLKTYVVKFRGFYNYEDLGKWLVYTYTILTQCIQLGETITGFGVHIPIDIFYYYYYCIAIQQLYRKLRQ